MIPEQTNRVLLYADKPGRYRGQCAEFCGLQHAHMGFYVFAEPPAQFRAWLAQRVRSRRRGAGSALFVSRVRQLPRDPRHARRRHTSGPT